MSATALSTIMSDPYRGMPLIQRVSDLENLKNKIVVYVAKTPLNHNRSMDEPWCLTRQDLSFAFLTGIETKLMLHKLLQGQDHDPLPWVCELPPGSLRYIYHRGGPPPSYLKSSPTRSYPIEARMRAALPEEFAYLIQQLQERARAEEAEYAIKKKEQETSPCPYHPHPPFKIEKIKVDDYSFEEMVRLSKP